MTKQKENCDCGCCCKENNKDEEVKMYFCPKCKSKKVKPIQGWRNAFGIIPEWRCDNCGFENMAFPIMVMNKIKRKRRI